MNANRMLMGAAIIGCLTAAVAPGAYAQEGGMRSSAQSNARANGQVARHAATGERRVGTSPMRQGRRYAEQGTMRGERRTYVRAGIDGGYRGERMGYRDSYDARGIDGGFGTTGGGYAYQPGRLYAYAPTYAPGYVTEPGYGYAPSYDVSVNAAPYYAPAYDTPYDNYGPGVGIGIGPIGMGIGPGWDW
jgi:hypothetical protein